MVFIITVPLADTLKILVVVATVNSVAGVVVPIPILPSLRTVKMLDEVPMVRMELEARVVVPIVTPPVLVANDVVPVVTSCPNWTEEVAEMF
jgi:hypothetical protein